MGINPSETGILIKKTKRNIYVKNYQDFFENYCDIQQRGRNNKWGRELNLIGGLIPCGHK